MHDEHPVAKSVIICICTYLYKQYLSFGKATEKSRAIVVNAEGGDGSKLCPSHLGAQTQPQSLVGICRGKSNRACEV